MRTAIVLFNRDLRVRDHPALAEAARVAEHVIPLFVLDDHILRSDFARPNRLNFMLESLGDLDASLGGPRRSAGRPPRGRRARDHARRARDRRGGRVRER